MPTLVSLRIILFNLLRLQHLPKCQLEIGKYTKSIPYIISSGGPFDFVVIGSFCSIGHGTILVTHPGHVPPKDYPDYGVTTYPVFNVKKHGFKSSYYLPEKRTFVKIGNDVTIGTNSIILPGVTIHDGAIVGAGSVVTHDVPPFAIVAGNPATIIKYRFSQDRIEKLLKIAWWNWSEQKIFENMDLLMGRVDLFIKRFYEDLAIQTKT